jgi:3D (Asp-Asp-Asp) domain-containing protein
VSNFAQTPNNHASQMLNMTQYGYSKREIKQPSRPASSPQYTVTIPKGTRVRLPVPDAAVVDDTAKVIGSNAADLQHYFTWIDLADVDIEPSE